MDNQQQYLDKYLKNKFSKINVIIDSFDNNGEGEKKIVFKIHDLPNNSDIMVYSPDADVILLMLLETNKYKIQIMRYDQQLLQLDIINIIELNKIIIKYIKYELYTNEFKYNVIVDIVMLFTILGNDFLPKLKTINTKKHIPFIFDAYKNINISNQTEKEHKFIFQLNNNTNRFEINWVQLKYFFINLKNKLKYYQEYQPNKIEWTIEKDQLINKNAIPYFKHIFNINNLAGIYDPNLLENKKTYEPLSNKIINRCVLKYLQGFIWMKNYYLNNDLQYKFYFYKYNYVPSFSQIIYNIDKIIRNSKIIEKIMSNLNKTIIDDKKYFSPVQQLIFITPINCTNIISKKLLIPKINKIAQNFIIKYGKEYTFIITKSKINIFDYLDCSFVSYLSKCKINDIYISGRNYLKDLI